MPAKNGCIAGDTKLGLGWREGNTELAKSSIVRLAGSSKGNSTLWLSHWTVCPSCVRHSGRRHCRGRSVPAAMVSVSNPLHIRLAGGKNFCSAKRSESSVFLDMSISVAPMWGAFLGTHSLTEASAGRILEMPLAGIHLHQPRQQATGLLLGFFFYVMFSSRCSPYGRACPVYR